MLCASARAQDPAGSAEKVAEEAAEAAQDVASAAADAAEEARAVAEDAKAAAEEAVESVRSVADPNAVVEGAAAAAADAQALAVEAMTAAASAEAAADQAGQSALQARDSALDAANEAKDQAKATADEAARKAKEQAKAAGEQALARLNESLSSVESDALIFGIFPNTAGFMDARLHVRQRYLQYFSSGLYLDYSTGRDSTGDGTESQFDRLVKEYRAQADLFKGVWLVKQMSGDTGTSLSLEPGLGGKFIYQDIRSSGFTKNSFEETLFQSTDTDFYSGVTSLRAEMSFAWRGEGRVTSTGFDVSGEYLPLIYSNQRDTTVTSQFDKPVKSSITNRTTGLQIGGNIRVGSKRAGRYTLRGAYYRDDGQVKSRARVTSGNFEYRFDTFNDGMREDITAEIIHGMTYVKLFGALVPAFGLAYQRKRIATADNSLTTDVFKLAILLETE